MGSAESQRRKKLVERAWLDRLMRSLGERIDEDPIEGERPDFSYVTPKLGVEVTELMLQELKRDQSEALLVLRRAAVMAKGRGAPSAAVRVEFSITPITKTRREALAHELSDLATQMLRASTSSSALEVRRSSLCDTLPPEVDSLRVHALRDLKGIHDWSAPSAAWLQAPQKDQLQAVLQSKSCELDQYREQHHSYWLIVAIPAGEHAPTDLGVDREGFQRLRFWSNFDRTFLMQAFSDELLELEYEAQDLQGSGGSWRPCASTTSKGQTELPSD